MFSHRENWLRSTWIVLISLAILAREVRGIRGLVGNSRGDVSEWDTNNNELNINKNRKLAHKGISEAPSVSPSVSLQPSISLMPTPQPSMQPSTPPTPSPTSKPTSAPTPRPTTEPTGMPTSRPTPEPSSGKFLKCFPFCPFSQVSPYTQFNVEPSSQPSFTPTDSSAPSTAPTTLVEKVANEREDGTWEYISDCTAEMPEDASAVTDQLIQFQYKLFLQEGVNPLDVLDYVENSLHNNLTAEFVSCPYKNLTGLPFEVRSLNSSPKDEVLRSCDEHGADASPCFLIGAAFSVEIFSYIATRRLQQADLRVVQAFGPFLDNLFKSGWIGGSNSEVVALEFEGFTNVLTGLPTYGGNNDIEQEPDVSGVEGRTPSDGDFNKGPVIAGILVVAAAAIILVVVIAMAYRKRREETLDIEKLQERGVIRPEESLAKAMDLVDDDSIFSEAVYTVGPTQQSYVIPDDASTDAGSAILREYNNKYSRKNDKFTGRPIFISMGPNSEASVLPAHANRPYNSNDTVDL